MTATTKVEVDRWRYDVLDSDFSKSKFIDSGDLFFRPISEHEQRWDAEEAFLYHT